MFLLLATLACTKSPAVDDSAADDSAPAGPSVTHLASPGDVADAAPSPDGALVYYVDGAVLGVIGGGDTRTIAEIPGANGVVTDGEVAYVADGTQVLAVGLSDGSVEAVDGAGSTGALAVELAGALLVGGEESGMGAVFSVEGGVATTLVNALPSPVTGVVGGTDGKVYAAAGDSVYSVADGAATALVSGVQLGDPAGIALTPDGAALMVSSLSEAGTSQVLLITLSDNSTAIFDEVISANHASGGLHRAAALPTAYAWAGRSAGVYGVNF